MTTVDPLDVRNRLIRRGICSSEQAEAVAVFIQELVAEVTEPLVTKTTLEEFLADWRRERAEQQRELAEWLADFREENNQRERERDERERQRAQAMAEFAAEMDDRERQRDERERQRDERERQRVRDQEERDARLTKWLYAAVSLGTGIVGLLIGVIALVA